MEEKRKIVAIGGGEIRNSETLDIDRRIVELTGKSKPKALLIPTASGDPDGYVEIFNQVYGKKLGCETKCLKLIQNPPGYEEMSALTLDSDLIYVGGGNTYRMMKIWRRLGLDGVLREAASRGIVLSGLSAGAICWFRFGHSDSRSFSGKSAWEYIRVSGLGFIDALYCPHYHAEKREASLSQVIVKRGGLAIACDNNVAVEIVGDTYRILTSSENVRAYKIFKHKGEIVTEQLSRSKAYKPLESLLTKR